jgi:hypothetical protein
MRISHVTLTRFFALDMQSGAQGIAYKPGNPEERCTG